jgi:hypothetical protein
VNTLALWLRKAENRDVAKSYVRKLAATRPNSIPMNMLVGACPQRGWLNAGSRLLMSLCGVGAAGHLYIEGRNYSYALDRFMASLRLGSTDPFIYFSLGCLLIRIVMHKKMLDRQACVLRVSTPAGPPPVPSSSRT